MRGNQPTVQLDRLGLRILQRLAVDGRTSYSDLGRELKLSVNTVRDRILAMERRGLIRGYQAVLDEGKVGNQVHAFVFMQSRRGAQPIETLPPAARALVREVHRTCGRYTALLEMAAPDMPSLQETLQEAFYPAGYSVDRIVLLGERMDRIHQRREVVA